MMTLSEHHAAMSYLITEHVAALVLTHSPDTIRTRRQVLRALHRDLPMGVAYATTEQIRAWLATPGWSDNTRYTYSGHVLEGYRWWTALGYLDGDPTATIKRPRPTKGKPRPMSEEHDRGDGFGHGQQDGHVLFGHRSRLAFGGAGPLDGGGGVSV